MKGAALLLAACAAPLISAQEFLDRVDEALTFSFAHDQIRTRLSGFLDLEAYQFSQPPPALLFSDEHQLINPRLTLFSDIQLGPRFYFFAQARLDRGFDPADNPVEVRLDEYALRFTPWEDGRFNLQLGRFATVAGSYVQRHLSWDNPFINAPLPYEVITPVSDTDVPPNFEEFFEAGGDRYDRNPPVWGPSYTTGASIASRIGKFEIAGEIKNAALSSRPESWSLTQAGFEHPAFSGRVGWKPNAMWNIGASASDGAYLRPETAAALPPGKGLGAFHQTTLGQDASFAWHHWQLWAEAYETRWQVPNIGNADTFGYYLESKYKMTPQLFGAFRWNQQFFSTVDDPAGGTRRWAHDLWRTDLAIGYRFTTHTQLKLQGSLQHEASSPEPFGHLIAAQFTIRF